MFGAGRRLDEGPSLCEVGGSGTLLLPLFGDAEQQWPLGLRSVLYFLGLLWCFLGVAIVSDIFMGAIERITSEKTRRYNSQTGRYYTSTVWNPTVANLTLMALGSSAPEILLSVIETVLTNKMYAGDLGPGTIVGSAAFNLFVIIAVCISAIPAGEVRRIKELPVYIITASASIFAYLWLLFVLQVSSPNVVEPWEGILTLLFFPVLVYVAWLADKGYFSPGGATGNEERLLAEHMSKEELAELQAKILREYGGNLSHEQVVRIIAVQYTDTTTRAHYRVNAIRKLVGGKRISAVAHGRVSTSVRHTPSRIMASLVKKVVPVDSDMFGVVATSGAGSSHSEPPELVTLQFAAGVHAVLENAGLKTIKVVREGSVQSVVTVKYRTRDGTAKAQGRQDESEGEGDYIHAEGSVTFEAFETEKSIEIKILDDYTYEEDEEFYVDLFDPSVIQCLDETSGDDKESGHQVRAVLGKVSSAKIVIIDDDAAGIISWEYEEHNIQDRDHDFVHDFKIVRKCGGNNLIRCKYTVEADTAIPGKDFEAENGTVTLEDGVCEATVSVKILARGRYNAVQTFRVVLSDISEGTGAKFDGSTDGGADTCIATVNILPDKTQVERVDKVMSTLKQNWEKAKVGHASWKDQFKEAFYVNGGDNDDDDSDDESERQRSPPTLMDRVMHLVTLPWKLLFAFCPPTDYCGGWLCFMSSLIMIGLVTTIIGDIANLFGCVLPFMENEITAITLVALGTSLPDTFASKAAAEQDPYADASVGNVTGSNSVNVFLGLGLPWTIASLYWWFCGPDAGWDTTFQHDPDLSWLGSPGDRRKAYVVKAGSLGFSVAVFTCCAMVALFLLAVRRRVYKGELGGPKLVQRLYSLTFVMLWLLYVVLSVLKIKGGL